MISIKQGFIIGGLFALFGIVFYIHIASYDAGYAKRTSEYSVVTNNALTRSITDAASGSLKLNSSYALQQKVRESIADAQIDTNKEVVKYAQVSRTDNSCIDAEWLRVYNTSIDSTDGDSARIKVNDSAKANGEVTK